MLISTHGFAQNNQSLITLDNRDQSYDLSQQVYLVKDSDQQHTVRDIVAKFKSNQIQTRNDKSSVQLDNNPYWLIVPVKNNTTIERWYFDFGSIAYGRSGILGQLLIYEATQKKIFFNGLNNSGKDNDFVTDDHFISVTAPRGEDLTFVIYLYPTDYKHTSLPLKLTTQTDHKSFDYIKNSVIDYLPFVVTLSLLIILLGFLITSATGFIPLAFYYIGILCWYYFAEIPVFTNIIGIEIISTMMPVLISLIITIICLFTIPARYSSSVWRFLLFFMVIANAIALLLFSVVTILHIENKYVISILLSTMTLIFCCLFLVGGKSEYLKKSNYTLALWVFLLLVGQSVSFLSETSYLTNDFILHHADKLVLYPQFFLVFVGVIFSVKNEHTRQLLNYARQNQKTVSLLNAQKSKENTDHSRLLRVIEREREIMEELRARESERTEEMREAKNIADEANQAKSAFLAIVSHEIRTPMTGIMGMIKMLEDTPLSTDQKEYLMTVKDSGYAMLALLNDILDFSKIEDGSMDLENIEFDLKRVLNGVTMLMKGHADQKNLDLILNIDKDIPLKLYGDPTRLRQVLLNLVGNALKFTSKGHVSIHAVCHVDPTQDNIYNITFKIQDTGLGISKEAQKNLFTPFSQADSSISRKYGGTGLGLTICKTLVEAMGGAIEIQSREGAGATFSFTLPFASEINGLAQPKTKQVASTEPIKHKRLLVVDDNEINRKVIDGFLKKMGHTSILAEDGQKALSLLADDSAFDVLLLDIEMPGMSGLDLAHHILEDKSLQNIPMLAITGNVSDHDLDIYQTVGFKGHVAKPIEYDALKQAIENALTQNNDEIETISEPKKIKLTQPKIVKDKKAKTARPAVGKTLDEKMLKGLKDGLGSKQTRDLLDDLFDKSDEILGQLHALKFTKDKNAARLRAHELKGMAGNFGLKALSDKSHEIEQISKDEDRPFEDLIPHIDDLSALIERSKLAIKEFLDN